MQLLIYILILLSTVEFNKQLIDNVTSDPKEQKEWHYAQWIQWVIIYTSIAFICKDYVTLIAFGCMYAFAYDTLLNLRRGLDWNHSGIHDLPKLIKYILFILGLIVLIGKYLC